MLIMMIPNHQDNTGHSQYKMKLDKASFPHSLNVWIPPHKNIIWWVSNNQHLTANLGCAKWGMGVKEGERVDLLSMRKLKKWGKREEKGQTTCKEAKIWAVEIVEGLGKAMGNIYFFLLSYTLQQFYWGIKKLHIFKIYNLISFDIYTPMKLPIRVENIPIISFQSLPSTPPCLPPSPHKHWPAFHHY